MDIILGRQAIFNRTMDVIGYELLYRSLESSERALVLDADQASIQVILNAFLEIGLQELTRDKLAFINLTRNFFLGKYPLPFPPERAVIEVLEDIPIDQELSRSLVDLRRQNYVLALDDVTDVRRVRPLLGLAGIVKVDLRMISPAALPGLVMELKRYPVRLLAEKVETQQEFQYCAKLGFHFFQGYFFCKPTNIQKKRFDASAQVVMQALAQLGDPNISYQTIEKIVARDVSLSYKLLLLVNSGYYSLRTKVESLRQAMALIGVDRLRGWLTLLLLKGLPDKPIELAATALNRARMAELIARVMRQPALDTFYMSGLFSVLDAYLDQPMSQVVQEIQFAPEISQALVEHKGAAGLALDAIQNYELGKVEPMMQLGVTTDALNRIWQDSLVYSNALATQL